MKNPKATIVNIGCGLDTTFDRSDHYKIMYMVHLEILKNLNHITNQIPY